MIALSLALAAALALPPQPDAKGAALLQKLKLQCRDAEAVLPSFAAALAAEKAKDWPTAKSQWEAIIANCGVSPASQPPRVFRAQIAYREKDYVGVLTWLKDTPRVRPSRLNLQASMLAMSAERELGDQAAFLRERNDVEAADARALASEGRLLDSFEVNGTKVAAYQVSLSQGPFQRLIAFTVSPADPKALPESLMLTDDLSARAILKQTGKTDAAPYFLDAYTCVSHVTVKMLPSHGDQPPTYEDIKPLVVNYLTARTWTSGLTRPADMACAWPQYVAPGLTN